ncbi:MAG TPA: SUMF1/EgtB/PvdO family nonheme iron enzyme [Mycobacteriales bacterium]|jgi:hypothetical protein|nr:SUMF1/EgtB/PvdO family nonheme iron enzyme [Mycobacteriales bacterium]
MTQTQASTANEVQARPELFVACADADSGWVYGFLLPELGLDRKSVLTPHDFRPGAVVVEEFERAVLVARYTVLVLSPAFGTSQWSAFAELLASHDSVRRNSDRLVPVLLEPYELPLHLDFRVRLDCTARARWEPEAARLRELLHQAAPPAEQVPCPYPGLMAFGAEDAGRFFGREREADDILLRIRQQGFLLVTGPSGCGKSSLLCAGVLPRLDRGRWAVRSLRPDATPLRALADALGGEVTGASEEHLLALVRAVLVGPERLLLFVDQAEGVFVLPSREERAEFLRVLDLLRRVDGCVVLLAMRADFYADLMTSVLWPLGPGERVEIASLRGDALREAVAGPATGAGVHLEPVLLERLLRDAAEEPAALPLLQETMVLLWERRVRRLLTVSAYEELGGDGRSGLAAALATRADAALAALAPAQRDIARRILTRLVQLGEGRHDIRRRQPVTALRAAADDQALFDATLRHLADRRLLTLSRGDGDDATVDLGHEAMIGQWSTLRVWVDESRASELVRRRIERDAAEWLRHGCDLGELYRQRKLADALDWTVEHGDELGRTAVRFLAAARRRRLLRRLGTGTVAAATLAGVVWLAIPPVQEAWWQRQAQSLGPTAHLAGGPAIVGTDHRRVTFPPLDVDVHEVTNQQYRYCVRAERCLPPQEPFGDSPYADGDRGLPVAYVTAYQAAGYCAWTGRRLPTEDEWERAARGTGGRKYPWGDSEPAPGRVNAILGGRVPSGTVPATSPQFTAGSTPEGLENLAGNVAEFTRTRARSGEGDDVVREGAWNGRDRVDSLAVKGGGWQEAVNGMETAGVMDATAADVEVGFRCIARAR